MFYIYIYFFFLGGGGGGGVLDMGFMALSRILNLWLAEH